MFTTVRILSSLKQFASLIYLPENSTDNTVAFAETNYAILIRGINQSDFPGSLFAVNVQEGLSLDDLATEYNDTTNTNVSVEIPPAVFEPGDGCPISDRLFYTVFITSTLFLTPETNCDDYAIGSVLVTVDVNGCSQLSQEIELDFQELDQVCYITLHDSHAYTWHLQLCGI